MWPRAPIVSEALGMCPFCPQVNPSMIVFTKPIHKC